MALGQRISVDEQIILKPFKDGTAGPFLGYEAIYDHIREARRCDEENLSQGIWKIDLKRTDWPEVEKLCFETLSRTSKDLQICGWLCESWCALDGLNGLTRGVSLLVSFSKIFWPIMHPLPDSIDDMEHRIQIFSWVSETFATHLMLMSITEPLPHINLKPLSLSDWINASNLEIVIKRLGQDTKSAHLAAESKGQITLLRFRQALQQSSPEYMEAVLGAVSEAKTSLHKAVEDLSILCGKGAPSFGMLLKHLDSISSILNGLPLAKTKGVAEVSAQNSMATPQLLDLEQVASPSSPNDLEVTGRKEAYEAVQELSIFLKRVDPHSPGISLLDLFLEWQGKNLVQIIHDIQTGTDDAHQLLRLFGSLKKVDPPAA